MDFRVVVRDPVFYPRSLELQATEPAKRKLRGSRNDRTEKRHGFPTENGREITARPGATAAGCWARLRAGNRGRARSLLGVADQRSIMRSHRAVAGRAHAFAGATTRRGRQLLAATTTSPSTSTCPLCPAPTTAALEERKGGITWGRPHKFLVGNRSTRAIEYVRTCRLCRAAR
jgi:hypothetical protein